MIRVIKVNLSISSTKWWENSFPSIKHLEYDLVGAVGRIRQYAEELLLRNCLGGEYLHDSLQITSTAYSRLLSVIGCLIQVQAHHFNGVSRVVIVIISML